MGDFMQYGEHLRQRMVDRNISEQMIELIVQYGLEVNSERIFLGKKELLRISDNLKKIMNEVDSSIKKGGLTLVNSNNSLITVFHNYSGKNERKQKWRKYGNK